MEKKKRLKIIIFFLTLACIGLGIAVIILAVNGTTTPGTTTPETTIPGTTTPETTTAEFPSPSTTIPPIPSAITTQIPPGSTPDITTPGPTTPDITTPGITTPDTTEMTATPEPGSDDSIRALSEELLKNDINNMAKFITINIDADPEEGESLLELSEDALECPTIQALLNLYDNFEPSVDIDDNLGDEYIAGKSQFLDLVMNTDIMKIANDWMANQGIFEDRNQTLREMVDQIWFMPYAGSHSSGVNDSTGFEHTFVGQINGERVIGLHNWVRFSDLEQAGNITYSDFTNQTIFDGDGEDKGSVLKISFEWDEASKNEGTIFVGTSPELELALYTVCFFVRPNGKCPVQLNNEQFTITTMDYKHMGVISVANPNLGQ